jgi:hypothetical protein
MFAQRIHALEIEPYARRNGITPSHLGAATSGRHRNAICIGEAEHLRNLLRIRRRNGDFISLKMRVLLSGNQSQMRQAFFPRDCSHRTHQKISAMPAVSSGCGL